MPAKKGTAGSKKKPKRQALPGGAPVKKKAAKRACKYGPRGADGLCPKKPRSNPARQTSRNRTRVTARTSTSAANQAIDVLTNPNATSEQKRAAAAKVGEAIGGQAVKAGAKKFVKSSPVQRAKETATRLASRIPVGGVLGPFVTSAQQAIALMPKPEQLRLAKIARARADAALKVVEAEYLRKGQTLPKKQRNILLLQHIDYFLKHP